MLENWVGGAFALAGRHLPAQMPRIARLAAAGTGRSTKVDRCLPRSSPRERRIRFTEMEYGIPREHAAEAVRRVLHLAARPSSRVAYPIEVRFAAADDVILSASHARDVCYIAVHQDRKLDWEPYFRGVEEVMDDLRRAPALGQAPLPDRRDAGAALPALGRVPGAAREARSRGPVRERVHATGSSAPEPQPEETGGPLR